MFNRVFVLVLDGLGVGEAPDAKKYGDVGTNTFLHTIDKSYNLDVLEKLGLTELIGIHEKDTRGLYMKAKPINKLKDSLNGHYELMGCVSDIEYKVYPDGFPIELIQEIEECIHRTVIGNVAADGEILINQLGEMQIEQKAIIIYTSCDSVLQVAAHEDVISPYELYKICEKIRKIVNRPEYSIGRVIARPFTGKNGRFIRTGRRKDYALDAPRNVLDVLYENGIQTICIGKIGDMFNNKGISHQIKAKDNIDTIIVDPPRAGLDPKTKQTILDFKCNKISYVSCDPVTLARDLKELSSIYNIKKIESFDMFPFTEHIETYCVLEKR